ncbi:hypothetical protein [Stomatobaculum longum]|uniref:hypothetical protein n=1 Tax=Stomatobaculum longum TaxID=796942 RepID=UPI0028E42796|nr:hypothetical protein [Stomatobaculum longum]
MGHRHSRVNHALHRVQGRFFQAAMWAEVVIAMFIFVAIAIQVRHLPSHLHASSHTQFTEFIQVVLDILMCLELIMMLCRHDLDSIIEVMIFAVTKNLLVVHESNVHVLLGVVALALLFAIRKYLFLSSAELEEHKHHLDFIQQDRDD